MSANYSTISSNLDALWDRVIRLEGEFENSQYQSKFADLSKRVDQLEYDFGDFQRLEFAELSQRVDQLRSRFDTLRYKMESIDQQLRSIEDISYRLNNLEGQLNEFERWRRDIENQLQYLRNYCCDS